ncbi:hypothetical protein MMC12_003224 [Toensbergia leucococca]|nr:hypothetical protein [Toensbergia leucococca]
MDEVLRLTWHAWPAKLLRLPNNDEVVRPDGEPSSFLMWPPEYPNSPLGMFSKLPPELRCSIWQYLMPGHEHQDTRKFYHRARRLRHSKEPTSSKLAILRASRFLYQEISEELYRNRILYFCIDPARTRLDEKDMFGKFSQDFTDFGRFAKINIEIFAPAIHHSGQFARVRIQTMELYCALSRSPRLPEIAIHFLEKESATWGSQNGPCVFSTFAEEGDLGLFVEFFQSLRGVPHVKIHLPPQLIDDGRLNACIEEAEHLMTLRANKKTRRSGTRKVLE